MASIQRLETMTSNSPDGTTYGVGRFNTTLERSGSFRDGHEGRTLAPGAVGAGGLSASGTGSTGGGAAPHGELQPLANVLSLDQLSVVDQRFSRQVELRQAMNAATGVVADDPALGAVQSKPLDTFGAEDLKRLRSSLIDIASRARDRARHLNEAVQKLDRYRNTMQSRKRSRPDPNTHERPLSLLPAERPSVVAVHVNKGSLNAIPSHSSTLDTIGSQKGVDKSKSVVPNKRVRTSLADVRPEGRPSNLSVQRSSGVQERERDTSRPSSSLASPVEEKERTPLASNEGWEKTKMKGRRSAIKSDAANVVNGSSDDRDHKWSVQHQRLNLDSRSRPSEGHGFRSGPVHGITSIHKTEVSAQLSGSGMRGASKGDSECATPTGERGNRHNLSERERPVSKNGVKPSREESHPGPAIITKGKASRAPRSSSAAGTNPSMSRSSSFGEARERPSAAAQPKAQVLAGPNNRKRPAPSRSSSPPVAQWGIQRPQKMARVARRVNLPPVDTFLSSREEANGTGEGGLPSRDGSGSASTPGGRATTPGASGGAGLARRVTVSSTHSLLQTKPRVEWPTASVGVLESDESDDAGNKSKEKCKKQGGEVGEQKLMTSSQKMGNVVVPAKKTRVVSKEEGGGGDGVRRQGRSGRGAVAPRVAVVNPPPEKVEVAPAIAKLLRSTRVTTDTKPDEPGRPPTKKSTVDRKPTTRPRRLLGNGLGELSGESDDDLEQLVNAVKLAVNASASGCSSGFWRQVEPYFAYVTSNDLSYLRQQTTDLEESDSALHIPSCGDHSGKVDLVRSSGTPPVSPNLETGGKSMCLANGSIESGGGFTTKNSNNTKDRHENGCGGRRWVNGISFDKIFSLSQRLLSAFINEGQVDNSRKPFYEACLDQPFAECPMRDSESPLRPSSRSESERTDYERQDPDGESDSEIGKQECDGWSHGVRDGGYSEGSAVSNGHMNRPGGSFLRGDDLAEGEDILADAEGEYAGRPEWVYGDEMFGYSKDDHQGIGRQAHGAGMTPWEGQFQRMSLDDRLLLELQSIGLLPEQLPDFCQREDDEISEELRKMQYELKEQVCNNKGRIKSLESAVLARKEAEDRAREHLAMEKLVELAYTRRMGRGGNSGSKGAAAKGARAAALTFAKRVLARVHSFKAGHGCIVDPTLRDLLFCVNPKVSVAKEGAAGALESDAGVTPVAADAPVLVPVPTPKPPAAVVTEALGRPAVRRPEGRAKTERDLSEGPSPLGPPTERVKPKEEAWPSRAKEREVLLEDVAGPTSMRDVKTLGINGLGGTKGKRSERDRDGKGSQYKEGSHSRSGDSTKGGTVAAAAWPNLGNIKGERKTKTKPRLKNVPLLKPVNGLFPKPPIQQQFSKGQAPAAQQPSIQRLAHAKQELAPILLAPVPSQEPRRGIDSEAVVDLSQLPLPGMEDMGTDLSAQALGAWLDFEVEDPSLQPSDELLMGLDVPMDDLSDLNMMM